jgi:hypothetical protein
MRKEHKLWFENGLGTLSLDRKMGKTNNSGLEHGLLPWLQRSTKTITLALTKAGTLTLARTWARIINYVSEDGQNQKL